MKQFNAGTYVRQGSYRSFQPTLINRLWVVTDMEVLHLLSEADRHLGRLDMFSAYVPNIDLFISMHVFKEATQSSRIEGTQTRIEDALQDKEDLPQEKRDDWQEVHNYIAAMHHAVEALGRLPFSSRLICEAHRVLMQGVRGEHKEPGAYRRSQNWIGGATLQDAIFVPPIHASIGTLMGDLESFVHNNDILLPDLLKIALVHYQFETIHPFLDGNGRVGRLLIPLYLVEKNILKQPILYLSDYFERHRTLYYDNLMRVREQHDLAQWFRFFLSGVIETSKKGIATFDAILQLQKDVDTRLQNLGSRAGNARMVLRALYLRPLTNARRVERVTGLSTTASYRLVAELEAVGILREITGSGRGRQYVFDEYLNLFT